jgi:hypothetical protein
LTSDPTDKAIILFNYVSKVVCCLCCIGKARSAGEVDVSVVFPWSVVIGISIYRAMCSNVTAGRRLYLQNTRFRIVVFLEGSLYRIGISILGCFKGLASLT